MNTTTRQRQHACLCLVEHGTIFPTVEDWIAIFETADTWACEVLDWQALMATDAFRQLDFIQDLDLQSAGSIRTTRGPVRIDRRVLKSPVPAPVSDSTPRISKRNSDSVHFKLRYRNDLGIFDMQRMGMLIGLKRIAERRRVVGDDGRSLSP